MVTVLIIVGCDMGEHNEDGGDDGNVMVTMIFFQLNDTPSTVI